MDRPGEPTIREAVPTAGPVGSTVTIFGKNFGKESEGRVISFNSVKATEVTANEATTSDGVNRSLPKTADRGAEDQKNLQSGQARKADVDASVAKDTKLRNQSAAKQPGDVAAQTSGAHNTDQLGTAAYTERGEAQHGVSGAAATAVVHHGGAPASEEETITVTVPDGATPGDIVVTVAGIASNGSRFTVTAV